MEGEAPMSAAAQLQRDWKFEDLSTLPDDVDWRRFEILDGALLVSPSTGMRHEFVSQELRTILHRAGLPAYRTVGPIAVDLAPSYLIPDLIVVADATARGNANPTPADAVQVAVEIVSPGSVTADRITKPAQYAAYGIPVYLRVETEPTVTLTAYELQPGAPGYTEVGTWGRGETARLSRPFAVEIPIETITP